MLLVVVVVAVAWCDTVANGLALALSDDLAVVGAVVAEVVAVAVVVVVAALLESRWPRAAGEGSLLAAADPADAAAEERGMPAERWGEATISGLLD